MQPISVVCDSAGELIKAFGIGGNSPENLGYGYDPARNMVVRTNSGTPGVYGTNVLNQVTYDPSYTYTYDNNGNRTKRSAGSPFVEYAYDDENQMIRAATDTVYTSGSSCLAAGLIYDGKGRLRQVTESNWVYGAWTLNAMIRYVYDGMRVIQERDANGTPTAAYTRGRDLVRKLRRRGRHRRPSGAQQQLLRGFLGRAEECFGIHRQRTDDHC